MQGLQVTAHVGATLNKHGYPVGADKIVKTWAPSYDEAEDEKRRMEREHGGIVEIER